MTELDQPNDEDRFTEGFIPPEELEPPRRRWYDQEAEDPPPSHNVVDRLGSFAQKWIGVGLIVLLFVVIGTLFVSWSTSTNTSSIKEQEAEAACFANYSLAIQNTNAEQATASDEIDSAHAALSQTIGEGFVASVTDNQAELLNKAAQLGGLSAQVDAAKEHAAEAAEAQQKAIDEFEEANKVRVEDSRKFLEEYC